jgi:hypothetical protein
MNLSGHFHTIAAFPKERTTDTHWIKCWVNPRALLRCMWLFPLEVVPWFFGHPALLNQMLLYYLCGITLEMFLLRGVTY